MDILVEDMLKLQSQLQYNWEVSLGVYDAEGGIDWILGFNNTDTLKQDVKGYLSINGNSLIDLSVVDVISIYNNPNSEEIL